MRQNKYLLGKHIRRLDQELTLRRDLELYAGQRLAHAPLGQARKKLGVYAQTTRNLGGAVASEDGLAPRDGPEVLYVLRQGARSTQERTELAGGLLVRDLFLGWELLDEPLEAHVDGGHGGEDGQAALEPTLQHGSFVELAVELDAGAGVEKGEE